MTLAAELRELTKSVGTLRAVKQRDQHLATGVAPTRDHV